MRSSRSASWWRRLSFSAASSSYDGDGVCSSATSPSPATPKTNREHYPRTNALVTRVFQKFLHDDGLRHLNTYVVLDRIGPVERRYGIHPSGPHRPVSEQT